LLITGKLRGGRRACAHILVLLGPIITHRLASVRNADRIYVLHHGRIAEQGGHAELMALGGQYAELYTLQASQYDSVAGTSR
jgi:ATP-binding cassette, subfamily B, bacterial